MNRLRPSVFIGSSSEGRRFAIAVQAALRTDVEVTPWNQGILANGKTYIESPMAALSKFDFAIVILLLMMLCSLDQRSYGGLATM